MNLPPIDSRNPAAIADALRAWKRILEQADAQARKQNGDVTVGRGTRVVLQSPNGTQYALAVSDTGAVSAVAL